MNTKETSTKYSGCKTPDDESTREKALDWWDNLPEFNHKSQSKTFLYSKYKEELNLSSLTDEQIEEIWRKEVQIPELNNSEHNSEYLENQINEENAYDNGSGLYEGKSIISKSNQKQFKQFDESLFKSYIDKFSDEDKLKARNIIESTIPSDLLIEDALKRLEE